MKDGFKSLLLLSLTLLISSCTRQSNVTGPSSSASWTELNGLPSFNNIVQDATGLFASGSGIYRSTDGGETWVPVDTSLKHGNGAIALMAGGIYSGDRAYLRGIFFSPDHGSTWASVDSGLGGQYVGEYQPISCLLTYGVNIFAGTSGNGVFRSTGSSVWTAVNAGMYNGAYVNCLAAEGDHIIAGTQLGIYISTDDGTHWTLADSGFNTSLNPSQAPFVVSLAVEGTNVFAGTYDGKVFMSTNDGTSWANVTHNLPTYGEFNVWLAATDSSVYVGCDGGIFASINNGSSWTSVTANLPGGGVGSIAVVGKYLYANAGNGVWRRAF